MIIKNPIQTMQILIWTPELILYTICLKLKLNRSGTDPPWCIVILYYIFKVFKENVIFWSRRVKRVKFTRIWTHPELVPNFVVEFMPTSVLKKTIPKPNLGDILGRRIYIAKFNKSVVSLCIVELVEPTWVIKLKGRYIIFLSSLVLWCVFDTTWFKEEKLLVGSNRKNNNISKGHKTLSMLYILFKSHNHIDWV